MLKKGDYIKFNPESTEETFPYMFKERGVVLKTVRDNKEALVRWAEVRRFEPDQSWVPCDKLMLVND